MAARRDHIGAIYLANDLGVPLYATPFTAGLIAKIGGRHRKDGSCLPMGGELTLGDFHFKYVALARRSPREMHPSSVIRLMAGFPYW
jgi:ribonuclease J